MIKKTFKAEAMQEEKDTEKAVQKRTEGKTRAAVSKINFEIDVEKAARFQLLLTARGTTIKEFFERYIDEFLEKNEEYSKTLTFDQLVKAIAGSRTNK
jgi:hypothetical protein